MFTATAAFVVVKTGRDALYFSNRGILDLPRAYIGIALLALPVAAAALGLMRLVGPRPSRIAMPIGIALMLVAFARLSRPGGGMTLFFMLVTLAFGVLFSTVWLLAADVLKGATREDLTRAYDRIGAASILGGLAGGALARLIAGAIDARGLVLVGAGLLALTGVGITAIQHDCPPGGLHCRRGKRTAGSEAAGQELAAMPELEVAPAPSVGPGQNGSLFAVARSAYSDARSVLRERYATRMLVIAMLAAVAGVLIEFQFYLTVATMGRDMRHQVGLFANAYLLLNATALVLQIWMLPRLQRAVGVRGALLVLPGVLLGGGMALLVTASALVRAGLRVTEGSLKSSIHRTSWEQAYLPFDGDRRPIAKVVIDGAGTRLAEGVTCVALLLWMRGHVQAERFTETDQRLLVLALLACVGVWIAATIHISSSGRRLKGDESFDVFSGAPPPDG